MTRRGLVRGDSLSLKRRPAFSLDLVGASLRGFALLSLLLLTACAFEVPLQRKAAIVEVSAIDSLNPDANARPSTLVVRLYELTAESPFTSEGFSAIYEDHGAALGETLVAAEEFEVSPGETLTIERDLDPATRFLGIVAAYSEVAFATWRDIVEVPPNRRAAYDLELDSLSVSIKPSRP